MVETSLKRRHANPVYAGYFADPFVWKVGETYYAIGTGEDEANGCSLSIHKVFPVLRSDDFYQWSFVGSALLRPDVLLGENFWAPAVGMSGGQARPTRDNIWEAASSQLEMTQGRSFPY